MYLPAAAGYAASAWESSDSKQSPVQKWSSAIGIVTAILGNVLISFALNTQRYAHMRINRDLEDRQEEEKKTRRRQQRKRQPADNQRRSYGTQQNNVAEARAEANASAEVPARYSLQHADESSETQPLIPSVASLDKSMDSQSDDAQEGEADGEESAQRKSYLRSPIWWLGIVMMTVGETGNFLAYGFAPASLVSPLGVVALISNGLIAPWLLKESFRWRDGGGILIAVAGCVTIVLSANDSNPKLDPDTIWHLITRWEFETYLGITVALIIVLAVASNRFGDQSVLIDLGLMGLFGGYTALSTKGVASLLSNTIWRTLTFPITYLLVAVLVASAIMQIKYVNRALQRFDSTQVIPIQFVLFTLSVITGSAILYRDFERTSTEDALKFVAGCGLTFLGVWCITSGRNDESQDDEELGEDEDAINLVDEEGVQPEIREREDWQGRRQSLIAASPKSTSGPPHMRPRLPNNEPAFISPANAAAIHSSTTSDLPSESRRRAKGGRQPPPIHATTSDITVPTLGVPSTSGPAPGAPPTTPLKRVQSATERRSPRKDSSAQPTPLTPAQRASLPASDRLDPNYIPQQNQRPPTRHSVSSGLLPGPLTSPLSSSLSAVVADSLRRGVDYFPSSSLRRRPERLKSRPGAERLILSPNAAPTKRHSIASAEMDIDEEGDDAEGARGIGTQGGRMRSLSATLGDIFGTPKKRRVEEQSAQQPKRRQERESEGGSNARSS